LNIKEILNLREVAEYLGCGRSQTYKIIRPGPRSLPAYRCGRKVLVRRADLEAWLEKNRYKPESVDGSQGPENAETNNHGEQQYRLTENTDDDVEQRRTKQC
jgi:excisionase family DNA binding protein